MINGKQYVDGGNREVIPSKVVVNNLSTSGNHEIYVLSNNPHELVQINTVYTGIIDVLFRAITMFIQEVRETDLQNLTIFKNSVSNVKIYYIRPDHELDLQFPTGLRFDKIRMRQWMVQGEQKAREVLDNNPSGNWGLVV